MKKIFFILFLFASNFINAQNIFYIGFKSGLKSSNIKQINFSEKVYSRIGNVSGIDLEYLISPKFGIGIDILYKQMGFAANQNFDNTIILNSEESALTFFKYDYLTIPLKIKIVQGFNPAKLYSLLWNFGFVNSTLMNSEVSTSIFDSNKKMIEKRRMEDQLIPVKKYNALLFEVSSRYAFKKAPKISLSFSFSYQMGLKSITHQNFFPSSSIKYHELDLCFGLCYKFGKKTD